MARAPVHAAGGIVVRGIDDPLIAIVQLRKDKTWVLPKGKLKPDEDALAAARREVLEETGHDVAVGEFLGSMSREADGKIKIVQFWHMQAAGGPVRKLMRDVRAVRWLPLQQAVEKLTHVHEQVFLNHVGLLAIKGGREVMMIAATTASGAAQSGERPAPTSFVEKIRAWFRRMSPRGEQQA